MNARWTAWLAISLWTITVVLTACAMVLMYAIGDLVNRPLSAVTVLTVAGSYATGGALLASHRPGNPIGWIFLGVAPAVTISVIAYAYGQYITTTAPGRLPEVTLIFWLGAWTWIPLFMLPPMFGILLFPTGRLPSRRWRPFAWFSAIWILLYVLTEMFSPGPLDPEADGAYSQFTNPVGLPALSWAFDAFLAVASTPVGLLPFVVAIASIFARLRVATAVERQQIKWFAYAATIPLIGILVENVIYELSDSLTRSEETAGSFIELLGGALLPVAIGIAILRHNLYDIDRLINRTLVYGTLTATLLAAYFTVVLVLGGLMRAATGETSPVVVAVSTLAVAGLFRPLRARIQSLVDRRFYRHKYDAERTLDAFSARLRDELDLDTLTGELRHIIEDTMQPVGMSVWLRPRASLKAPDLVERRQRKSSV